MCIRDRLLGKGGKPPSTQQRYVKELNEEDPLMQIKQGKKAKQSLVSLLGRRLYAKDSPPNRFGIIPGSRWDGVDRSNGFEKKWINKKREIEEKKLEDGRNPQDDY